MAIEAPHLIPEGVLAAPPVAVAGVHYFFGISIPEWAAIVAFIYTVLLILRLLRHEWIDICEGRSKLTKTGRLTRKRKPKAEPLEGS